MRKVIIRLSCTLLICGGLVLNQSQEVFASPYVYGGEIVLSNSLLGDSGCVTTTIGPIRCLDSDGTVSVLANMGPLAGKTIIDFSGDGYTNCAITSDYVAYCWGSNELGAIGDNTTTDKSVPTPVYTDGALTGVSLKRIAANSYGACAVSTLGNLYCWGETFPRGGNIYDRFYTGESTETHLIPPKPVLDSRLTSIAWADVSAIGSSTICAISTFGVFKCFGASIETFTTSALSGGETIVSMSAARQYGDLHICALTSAGKVLCNGASYFQPATTSTSNSDISPVSLPTTAISVRVADLVACAVLSGGGLSCWGYGMARTTGLGLFGYPVVNLLPSGSRVSAAVPLRTSYSSFPLIVVRKDDGQVQTFKFTSNYNNAAIPNSVDATPTSPTLTLGEIHVNNPTTDSRTCKAASTQICVSIDLTLDSLSSTSVNYRIYSDATVKTLEKSGTTEVKYGKASIGIIDGLKAHWVMFTVTGPFGSTTSSPLQIKQEYAPPSSAIISASANGYPACFDVDVTQKVNDGGLAGVWTFTITNTLTKSSMSWDGELGCLKFFKTSSSYKIDGTFTTPAGSTSASANFNTYSARLKRSVYKSSKYSLKSIFVVQSPGKQTWSASRGCSIRSGYLYTSKTYSCSINLKIAAAKGYRKSSDTFGIYLR